MKKSEASAIVGGLSNPSKMPGKALGISAEHCQTGSKLRQIPGSACSDCYACKGMYPMPNVRAAHARRLSAIAAALADDRARAQWVAAMVTLLQGESYFRWHDSGDLQSAEHFGLIAEVCRATPTVRHWLPTKEPRYVTRYLSTGATMPENLTVRISSPMVDTAPVKVAPLFRTSTIRGSDTAPVYGHRCTAPDNAGQCGDCRACWDPTVANVTYLKH